ncbi:endonuclease/exonuclease/phosphatase family protein [Thermophagus sp. OGC60D27]|uniref:endonuclease/exonuclease/phosphatase family protein n=1 Tax=Thermophagus sp. OGC60D27 TaxID=3458415 RepID=UPI0040377344
MKQLIPFISILVIVCTGCDPFHTVLDETDVRYYLTADAGENTLTNPKRDSLQVMTWNIKFGGGRIDFFFDCHGDRVIMDSSEVITHLNRIADFIRATQPHILFVQEIDVNSKRSAFIDQVEWILSKTHFHYAVYAPQWRADLIPSNGLGRMNSGNAIFSVTPLFHAQRIGLPLIEEQHFWVRYFYLRRHLLDVCTVIGGDTIHLLNTHLSAYSTDGTKKKQLDLVFQHLDSLDRYGASFVIGGDFNTLPPATMKVKDFPDSACQGEFEADDYSGEEEWMQPFYNRFSPAIPLSAYQRNNRAFFTHSTSSQHFWNRKLDYIFSNLNPVQSASVTYQSFEQAGIHTMDLSDHCAIEAIIKQPTPPSPSLPYRGHPSTK